jgi:hypothetical protein
MSLFKASWKNFLLTNKDFETSNKHLSKIRELADPGSSFEVTFEIVSKIPALFSFPLTQPSPQSSCFTIVMS